MPGSSQNTPATQGMPPQRNTEDTQLLRQIAENQRRGNSQGVVIYNNTGGSAVVSSTQLGGFG